MHTAVARAAARRALAPNMNDIVNHIFSNHAAAAARVGPPPMTGATSLLVDGGLEKSSVPLLDIRMGSCSATCGCLRCAWCRPAAGAQCQAVCASQSAGGDKGVATNKSGHLQSDLERCESPIATRLSESCNLPVCKCRRPWVPPSCKRWRCGGRGGSCWPAWRSS